MSEAAKAVIDFLFAEVGVNRVGIEGTKRESFKTLSREFLDMSDYGIVRSDWEKLRESPFQRVRPHRIPLHKIV